jgi:hypothetical protein
MHADSGRGKGELSPYGAANGGDPALEIRIRRICTTPPHHRDEARAAQNRLRAQRLAS